MPLLSRFRGLLRGEFSAVKESPSQQSLDYLLETPQLEAGGTHTPGLSGASLSQRYAQVVQDLRSSILPATTYHWLDPEHVTLVGEHPIAAGGSSNIWEATHGGRKVVLKSYRYCASSDIAQVIARFSNEVHVYRHLHCGDVDVVPFVGVYSTGVHPFGLVYEYMEGLDLKQYLRNEPNVRKLEMLTGLVRCLNCMHNLDIVHGDLQTANILVNKDRTPRISGLGNAFILPHSTTQAVGDRNGIDRLSRNLAPELVWPNAIDPIHPTKASDMYAFGVMAFEVLTGQPPFSDMTEIAAMYSMVTGNRPLRVDHHEIPATLWYMIERCWCNTRSKRMSAGEALKILETEFRHI